MIVSRYRPRLRPPRLYWLIALGLVWIWSSAAGGEIRASLSQDKISIDDSFELRFEVAGSADFSPDFSPLERDFEILQQSRNQSIRMLNGELSSSTTWLLTLMPRGTGRLEIPPIGFGQDRSPPLQLQVLEARAATGKASGEDLLLEVEATPERAQVQSQILYTVRLLVPTTLGNVSVRKLTSPRLASGEAVIEQLGEERQFRARRGNLQYTVLERRYAIFPQQSGPLTLQPILFEGEVGRGLSDPFGMLSERFFQNRSSQIRRARSRALELEILPKPKEAATPWLPAEHVELAESWSADTGQLTVGQSVTRTLVLIADGLTSAQLPALAPLIPLPEDLKAYPDQPTLDDRQAAAGVTGTRQEKTAIIPTRPGSYTLPELRIPWWDTKANRQQFATISERRIEVVPAPAEETLAPPPATTEGISDLAAESASSAPLPTPDLAPETNPVPWRWLSLFLGLGWLATVAAWGWRARRRPPFRGRRRASQSPAAPSLRAAARRVRQAFTARDPHEAKQALLAWGATAWPSRAPAGLGELAARCDGKTGSAILELHRSLYSPEPTNWSAYPVWEHLPLPDGPGAETSSRNGTNGTLYPLNP